MITVLDDYFGRLLDIHVKDVLKGKFEDLPDGDKVFKGLQDRKDDIVSSAVSVLFPWYTVATNFVRKSPKGQEEPNFIHHDKDHADLTVLLYLNRKFPKKAGTTLYDEDGKEMVRFSMKYGRLIAFPSEILHSRNIRDNFGTGRNARLVQVLFLKEK